MLKADADKTNRLARTAVMHFFVCVCLCLMCYAILSGFDGATCYSPYTVYNFVSANVCVCAFLSDVLCCLKWIQGALHVVRHAV